MVYEQMYEARAFAIDEENRWTDAGKDPAGLVEALCAASWNIRDDLHPCAESRRQGGRKSPGSAVELTGNVIVTEVTP